MSLLPNRQVADEELSTYKLEYPPEVANRSRIKEWLEKHKTLQTALLIMVMIGTCMVIGDGVLTPAISGNLQTELFFPPLVTVLRKLRTLFGEKSCLHLALCYLICLFAVFSAVSGLELSLSRDQHECKVSTLNSEVQLFQNTFMSSTLAVASSCSTS